MALIDKLLFRLQRHPKRVVFPEGADPRILQAARQFATKELGIPILLGDRVEIKNNALRLDIKLDGLKIIDPARSDDLDRLFGLAREMDSFAGKSDVELRAAVSDTNYFGALMLVNGMADAFVSGATHVASSGLKALFKVIPTQDHVDTASSMLILDQEDSRLGEKGALFLADCGVIPDPTASQLADIGVTTACIAKHLTNAIPRVAMLSFSTKSPEAQHPSILKIREATQLALEKSAKKGLEVFIDGEIQVDAALDEFAAKYKGADNSPVGGCANVLIFPDLNSGNIASKMVQIITGARAYGYIITGLTRPCAEISRGAHAYDIFGTAVIVCSQAIRPELLYGSESEDLMGYFDIAQFKVE